MMLMGIGLIMNIYGVIVGVMGVIHCNNTQKATLLLGLIGGYIVLRVIDIIATVATGSAEGAVIFGASLGFLLPSLFLSGVLKNRNSV
jgi:hypothetical protein